MILVLGAGVTAAIGLGLLEGRTVAGIRAPERDQPILNLNHEPATTTTIAAVLVIAGIIIGILCVLWLLAQVPRKHGASDLKLQDPDNRGLTVLKPGLLEDAISDRVEELEDVTGATTIIRGSSRAPDITVRITTTSHADLPRVIADVEHRITNDLNLTLGRGPASLGIAIEVKADPKNDDTVTFQPSSAHT
ncbi:hypothetical protein [Arthrobacter sp. Leaf234]|uniref:hypothetical protein n=1 Tax=Arthrobacter sp. Leaf234 TaxID=1736303 RepID=UPI0012FAA9FC|nr:hypothetical protein [Arthrobacter sp. Leaf234]